jgi:2'-5' RNA ligase
LIAIDVALLPPADVTQMAIDINASLDRPGFQGLRLDANHVPHITLTQQFVSAARMDDVRRVVGSRAMQHDAVRVRVLGAGRSGGTVWMAIEKTPSLIALHVALMEALAPMEEPRGTALAFAGGDARPGDVAWVSTFRAKASFARFTPHITLGHSARLPAVEPMEFVAARLAICPLGRFGTCRTILEEWRLA